jgi:hypothetical protein
MGCPLNRICNYICNSSTKSQFSILHLKDTIYMNKSPPIDSNVYNHHVHLAHPHGTKLTVGAHCDISVSYSSACPSDPQSGFVTKDQLTIGQK